MPTAIARVPTPNGGKYVRQLLKHWAHKLDVALEGDRGTVRFGGATAVMDARPDAIELILDAQDAETLERMKGVLASHLERFAFREAPLAFHWIAAEEAA